MDNLESQLGSILSDPEMMAQLQSLAQNLGAAQEPGEVQPPSGLPGLEPAMMQKLSGLMGQSRIEPDQQALLKALAPYLGSSRISRLEKAMRAARMAGAASDFFRSGR